MAERFTHHRSTFECVDAERVGDNHNHDGALFYHVEPRCGSLSCPPYEEHKEMQFAVAE